MKKFTFLSVALLLAASQAMAQFSTSPLVPQLKQESTGLNIAAKAPTKVKAQVPEAPISDRPAGKFYEVFGGFHYVASNNGMPYISSFSNRPSEIVEGTDGYVYIKNIPALLGAQTYIQAERGEGDTITIKKQIAYLAGTTEYYTTLAKWDDETNTVIEQPDATIKLIYKDGELNSIEEDKDYTGLLFAYIYGNDESGWTFGGGEFNLHFEPSTDVKTTLPEGLEPEYMVIKTIDASDATEAFGRINVAFTDTEVYIHCYEDAYAKGTIEGDKVTFEGGQYLGSYYGYLLYFIPAYVDTIYADDGSYSLKAIKKDKIVFDYDKEARHLKSKDIFIVNAGKDDLLALNIYWAPEIYPFVEVAAVPADPWISSYGNALESSGYNYAMFTLPNYDREGNYIDENKMAYKAYIDDELFIFSPEEYEGLEDDMEEVPYGFRNSGGGITPSYFMFYFYPDKNVGIQSIYYGGGERNVSNIVFKDIVTGDVTVVPDPDVVTGITANQGNQQVTGISYADLSGRTVGADSRGLVLVTVKRADGTQKTVKVLRK
jgi:hypothetical protein